MDVTKYALGKRCSLLKVSETQAEVLAKAHCLMMIHAGVNKNISNEAIYLNIETSWKGMESFYLLNKEKNKNLDIPLRVSIDDHDDRIYQCVAAIIKSKQCNPNSTYAKIRKSAFWGFSHDGITKFSKDLLGVFLQGVDEDGDPLVAVERLRRIPGGHTGETIAEHLVTVIADVLDVEKSAFDEIYRLLEGTDGYDDRIKPPEFFRLGKILRIDQESKEIHIKAENTPIANTGDGVASNGKASRILCCCYGFGTPSYHCSCHSVDLVIKRMAKSKTMSVPEVVETYNHLRPIIKHFQNSTKSKERLDKALEILHLNKLNLISWGGTRMCHFMTACHRAVEILPACHDALFSLKVREEERNALFTHCSLYVMCLMADLKPHFKDAFLRKNDKKVVLVSSVYRSGQKFCDDLPKIVTTRADDFCAGLHFDGNNNLIAQLTINNSTHTFVLNRNSRPRRGTSQEESLNAIKAQLENVKSDVMKNAIENVKSLTAKEETCYFMWAGLDLESKFDVSERLVNLSPLVSLFTEGRIQQVLDVNDCKTAVVWQGYTVYLHHPRRLMGSAEEFEKEFREGWPKISKMWLNYCLKTDAKQRDQLEVIKQFLHENASVYPNMCTLFYIMLATPANTSNVERAYSILEIICQPRRNKLTVDHLEQLFLLSVMREEVGDVSGYVECLKYLEKNEY